MRAAPALVANLDNARFERWLIVMLHILAGAVWLAWGVLHFPHRDSGWGLRLSIGLVVPAVAGLGWALARRALPMRPGSLCWTGQQWILRSPDDLALRHVQVTIDLGVWLLLRLQPAASTASIWRVAALRSAGPAWHALRVALHAHAGTTKGPDGANRGVTS